jgi:hypothetical protein
MGNPRELEWAKKPDALKESWTARIETHMVHGVSLYRKNNNQYTDDRAKVYLDSFLMIFLIKTHSFS